MAQESETAAAEAWSAVVSVCGVEPAGLVAVLHALQAAEATYSLAGLREGAQALRETRQLAAAAFRFTVRDTLPN
jgi:hypothetical protein